MAKKILVTGGAGFIGSHLTDRIVELGYVVHVLDNLSTGDRKQVHPNSKFHRLDIRDWDNVHDLFKREKFQVIFHEAAQMSVLRSVQRPFMDASINITGLLNLLDAGKEHQLEKLIFASSGGVVYGNPIHIPQDERHPRAPISPYGISKVASEKYLNYFWTNHGIAHVTLRYANVYGPRQSPKSGAGVIGIFMEKILAGEQPIIYGSGNKTRDYVYVSDVVEANIRALSYHGVGAFNIGTGIETNVTTIFREICRILDLNLPEVHSGEESGEQLRSVLDISKAKSLLGWEPKINFADGLKTTIQWYQNKK